MTKSIHNSKTDVLRDLIESVELDVTMPGDTQDRMITRIKVAYWSGVGHGIEMASEPHIGEKRTCMACGASPCACGKG